MHNLSVNTDLAQKAREVGYLKRSRSVFLNREWRLRVDFCLQMIYRSGHINTDAHNLWWCLRLYQPQITDTPEFLLAPQPRRAPHPARIAMPIFFQPRIHAIGEHILAP